MPVPSYLSSFLRMQQARGDGAFSQRFGGAWVVWEPGAWKAAPVNVKSTLTLAPVGGGGNAIGDFLCFHLGEPTVGRVIAMGREPGNDVVINDGTVSRKHVQFVGQGAAWSLVPQGGRTAMLNSVTVPATGTLLVPGQELVLGGARFTFHDVPSLLRRIAL